MTIAAVQIDIPAHSRCTRGPRGFPPRCSRLRKRHRRLLYRRELQAHHTISPDAHRMPELCRRPRLCVRVPRVRIAAVLLPRPARQRRREPADRERPVPGRAVSRGVRGQRLARRVVGAVAGKGPPARRAGAVLVRDRGLIRGHVGRPVRRGSLGERDVVSRGTGGDLVPRRRRFVSRPSCFTRKRSAMQTAVRSFNGLVSTHEVRSLPYEWSKGSHGSCYGCSACSAWRT